MDPYEWDETKYATNLLKHGVRFELVYEFDWDSAFFKPDRRFDYGEDRVIAFGRVDGRGYAIVFTRRGNQLRIISIRQAHEKEMRSYGR